MVKLVWQVLTVFFVIAVAGAMLTTRAGIGVQNPIPAEVLSFSRSQIELQFNVISNGCTREADFKLEYSDSPDFAKSGEFDGMAFPNTIVYLRLVRLRADNCRRRPMSYAITFPVPAQLEDRQVQLGNAFVPMPRLERVQ